MAEVGIDGCSVEAQNRKEGPGISPGGATNVTALGISDDRYVIGYMSNGLFEDSRPFGPQGFVESQVGLVGTDQVGGGLDNVFVEL